MDEVYVATGKAEFIGAGGKRLAGVAITTTVRPKAAMTKRKCWHESREVARISSKLQVAENFVVTVCLGGSVTRLGFGNAGCSGCRTMEETSPSLSAQASTSTAMIAKVSSRRGICHRMSRRPTKICLRHG